MSYGRWFARMTAVALLTSLTLHADERTTPPSPASREGVAPAADATSDDGTPSDRLDTLRQKEAAVRRALETRVTASFDERPLNEAIHELAKSSGLVMWIDQPAFQGEGVTVDESVTATLHDVPLRRALDRLFEPFGLTSVVDGEVLRITTKLAAEEILVTRVYDVARLVPLGRESPAGEPTSEDDGAWLVTLVQAMATGPWEDIDGTGGQVRLAGGSLIVRQTDANHREIDGVLAGLRTLAAGTTEVKRIDMRPAGAANGNAALHRKLAQLVTVRFEDKPLDEAFTELISEAGIPLVISETALTEEGIAIDEPVTAKLQDVTLATALRLITEEKGLAAVVDEGTLVVTTQLDAAERLHPVLYDVRDLVASALTLEELESVLGRIIQGPWQKIDGAGGVIAPVPAGALAILQTQGSHAELARLFDDLRRQQQQRTPEEAALARPKRLRADDVVLRFYPQPKERAADVLNAIRTFVLPESWVGARPAGTAQIVQGTIAIRHTVAAHKQIQQFLTALDKSRAVGTPPPQGFGSPGPASFFSLDDAPWLPGQR